MITVDVRTQDGGTSGTVDLDDAVFGIEPNTTVLHQVVNAQLAARRRGTHSTKTRAEVRGGGAKPWRQKGTGRSRQGSIRSPQWVGGGVAHGPRPRSYRQKVNKKVVGLALRSALSDRAQSDRVMVVDRWTFDRPRTKTALAALDALALADEGRVLLVLDRATDENVHLSFRNLPDVDTVERGELNVYDILRSDWLVFTSATLPAAAPAATDDATAEESSPAQDATVEEATAAETAAAPERAAEDTAVEDTAADDTAADDTAADDATTPEPAAADTVAEDTVAEDTTGDDEA